MKVKNIKTGDNYPAPTDSCSSWLEHWEKEINKKAGWCRCCRTKKDHADLVGGHVIRTDSSDKSWYITPLCKSCNSTTNEKEFEVSADDLVKVTIEHK